MWNVSTPVDCWGQLFKEWITLSNGKIVIQGISGYTMYFGVHFMDIYSVDSVTHPLDNHGLVCISEMVVYNFLGN